MPPATSDKLRFLFVDDEPESVESVTLSFKKMGHECKVENFSEAESAIETFSPDMVVLDMVKKGEEDPVAGNVIYDMIWQKRFCPVVVYSAFPDLVELEHPCVKIVKKGAGSVALMAAAVSELTPHVETLRRAEAPIHRALAEALRDVAPFAFGTFSDPGQRHDTLLRAARRRLAALMDDLSRHGQTLAAWEQYLFPPISKSVRLGDILRKAGRDSADSASFRLVLTPSCDMVAEGGREPKVAQVLVARCCSTKQGLALTRLGGLPETKKRERIPSAVLSQGYLPPIVPLPALPDRIPSMMANLRDLELLPIEAVGLETSDTAFEADGKAAEETRFVRVASLDSPFRELISWAYLQVACRPGLPERDLEAWCNEILEALKADTEEGASE